MIVLLRMPCLMEDEGNIHPIAIFDDQFSLCSFLRDYLKDDPIFRLANYRMLGGLSGAGLPEDSELRQYMPKRLDIREFK